MIEKYTDNCRFSFEEDLYNLLILSKNYKKISEKELVSISLKHKQQTEFDLISSGIILNEFNAPELFKVFETSKKILEINNKKISIDLYLCNHLSMNAGCIFLQENDYAIYLNSGLVNLMSSEELAFVIGHELGHLKFLHHKIIKEPKSAISPLLKLRLFEHSRYAEISADRCGLLCCNSSISVAKSALLKLASGTDLRYLNPNEYSSHRQLKIIKDLLESTTHVLCERLTHPQSQIRIFALEAYHETLANKNISKELSCASDQTIYDVLSLLNPKLDDVKNNLLIYGCLWVTYSRNIDQEDRELEIDYIEGICDPILLEGILKSYPKPSAKIFRTQFTALLSKNNDISTSAKSSLLEKIVAIAYVDFDLEKKEEQVLQEITKLLKLPASYLDALLRKMKG